MKQPQAVEPNPANVKIDGDLLAKLEAVQKQLAERDAQIAALKAASNGKVTPKVSKKGAVSVYGLQRFPITLYATQWARLFESIPQIQAFIKARSADLSTGRDDPRFANVPETPEAQA